MGSHGPLTISTLTLDDVRCPIAVLHTVVKRSTTLKTQEGERPNSLPRHKSQLAIGDNFIGFSALCVSHDFLLEHTIQTLDVSECSMSHKLFAVVHERLLFATSDVCMCEH